MKDPVGFHSGFVSIIGCPNVGKSSVMNAITGEKLSIVSNKPQTTRRRIMGICTEKQYQIVFLDTPGVHEPRNKLGEYMMKSVNDSLKSIDCLMIVLDVTHITERDAKIVSTFYSGETPRILVLNKIDLVRPDELLPITAKYAASGFSDIIPVSARTGDGIPDLIRSIVSLLPSGPKYFPDDMITDQPERILCAEIIREKLLRNLRDEVPHGTGVEIIRFTQKSDSLTEIDADIYCERNSHKGIIIGKNGSMLKTIGSEARQDIENLLMVHVQLNLWIKVKPDWRNNAAELMNLGYHDQ